MNVHIFRNINPSHSMNVYASELIFHLKQSPLKISEYSIEGITLPIIKDVIKEFFYPVYARFRQGEVNHITDHSYGSLAYLLDPERTVVSCHDLIPIELGGQTSRLGFIHFLHNIKGMLRVKHLVAASEHTKKMILKYYDYRGMIHVIYPGVSEKFKPLNNSKQEIRKSLNLDPSGKFLLHVAGPFPYKNTELILKVLKKMPHIKLIKVGRLTKEQWKLADRLNIRNQILNFLNVQIDQLVKFYNAADVFIFPSFSEGFGFPVLEAMACGCPVVASKAGALPEAGGNAVYYINPYSESDLKRGIDRLLEGNEYRDQLISMGLNRVKIFNWFKTALEVLNVYKKIAADQ